MTNAGVSGFPSRRLLTATDIDTTSLDGRYVPLSAQLTTGEAVFDRSLATTLGVSTVTQRMLLTYFVARKTETTTQVRVYSGSTAAAATPTLCRVGLYSVDSYGNLALVAATANDTALFASTNTAYTRSWSTPIQKTAGSTYAVGILQVSGGATATFLGANHGGSVIAAEAFLAPTFCANLSSQSDLPASVAVASLGSYTARAYSALLP